MNQITLDELNEPILSPKAGATRFMDINRDSFTVEGVTIGQHIRVDGRLGLDITCYSDCTHKKHYGKPFHMIELFSLKGPLVDG